MATSSISGKIADNLKSVLNGKSITYNGTSHTITAERQRFVLRRSVYPYVEIGGPWANVETRDCRCMDASISFSVVLYEHSINDETGTPISEVMQDVPSELIKLIAADTTRGGNAIKTDIESWGYAIIDGDQGPEFIVWVDVVVQAYILQTNPDTWGT